MEKITAIIPIKMKNQRLPEKNTKILIDRPLIHYVQETLLQAGMLDSINVYCSSTEICDYLLDGINFVQRPAFLDLDTSNFTQIFSEFKKEHDSNIYVYAHATAPYVTIETVKDCIRAVKSKEYDSAFCAVKIQDFLWQDNEPMNFDAENVPRSQDIKPIYRETSGVYVFTKEVFEKYHRRIGKNPYIKEVSFKEAVDINNYEDFILAEILHSYKNN